MITDHEKTERENQIIAAFMDDGAHILTYRDPKDFGTFEHILDFVNRLNNNMTPIKAKYYIKDAIPSIAEIDVLSYDIMFFDGPIDEALIDFLLSNGITVVVLITRL